MGQCKPEEPAKNAHKTHANTPTAPTTRIESARLGVRHIFQKRSSQQTVREDQGEIGHDQCSKGERSHIRFSETRAQSPEVNG